MLFALALTALGLACAPRGAVAAESESSTTLEKLIGDAACDDDSQCRTLPVGAKPCGGPAYYVAWSTKRTDAARLRDAAGSAVIAPRTDGPRGQSTCVFVTDPGAFCATSAAPAQSEARGVCRLREAGRGTPGRVD